MKALWRWMKEHAEVVSYLVFGGLTTVVNYLVYFAGTRLFPLSYLVANGIAWAVSVLFAYGTNRRWVFQSTARGAKAKGAEFLKFVGGRVASLGLDMLIMYLGITVLGLENYDIWVKTLSQVVVIVFNYVLSKYLVFKKQAE